MKKLAALLFLLPTMAWAQTHTMPGNNVVPSGGALTLQTGSSFTIQSGVTVTGLNFSLISATPTTIGGYGITDFNSLGDARWSLIGHTHSFASLTSKPTTLSGYGITDAEPALGNPSVSGYVLSSTTGGVRSWVVQSGGGGGGSSSFIGLTDVPASFSGAGTDYVRVNSGATALEFRTPAQVLSDIGAQASGSYVPTTRTLTINGTTLDLSANRTWTVGDALVANPLSQFASTTSSQLAGVLSDETGTGLAVFGTSPNITTPTGIVKGDVGLGNVQNVDTTNASNISSGVLSDTVLSSNIVNKNNPNVYTPGAKQSFQASATTAGERNTGVGADPSSTVEGDRWYRTDTHRMMVNNGTTNQPVMWQSDATFPAGAIVGTTDTQTLTNKRVRPRVLSLSAPGGTPSINTDLYDAVTVTNINAAITSMTTNLTGTPTEFDKLIIRFKDNGTARAITWGASFVSSQSVLPTTTVISKVTTVGFVWDTVKGAWVCIAVDQEP